MVAEQKKWTLSDVCSGKHSLRIVLISRVIAMRNNNYLNLINFKVKNFIIRDFFFLNEHSVGCSNFLDIVSMSRGVLERHVGCCNHDATWGV